jgi:hypothetical protein
MQALPQTCAALGLTLRVQPALAAAPAIPEALWREAELMERPTRVAVLPIGSERHLLALGRFGSYTVDLGAGVVEVHRQPAAGIALAEVLEGPVLLHALATRGIHALHASALLRPDGRVIAFTADSGTGKSSLAARAQAHGWVRVADDLLALICDHGRIDALPGLHQPKLALAEQPASRLPERLALAALYRLQRIHGPARLQALDAIEACTLLLRATVATRVYAPESLAEHLRFAARFAEAVRDGSLQIATLELPDRPEDIAGALDEALTLIQG